MGILGFGRESRVSMRAALWYPDGAAVRRLVAEELGPEEAARMARIEGPLLGTVHAVRDALGWDTAFQTDGGVPAPVVLSSGALYLTSSVAPQGVNRQSRDGGTLECWLAVREDAPLSRRRRLEEAGWRIGRSKDTPLLIAS